MIRHIQKSGKFMAMAAVAAGALFVMQGTAQADTIKTETITTQQTTTTQQLPQDGVVTERVHTVTEVRPLTPETGTRLVNLNDFDLNHDGVLSRRETGEMLFKLLDSDGNQIIDNIEFEKRNMMTLAPMEKETTVSYDFNNDGQPDKVERSSEKIEQQTMLSAFDKDGTGMSPKDLAGKEFLNMDVNRDSAIDIYEWRGSYDEAIDKQNRSNARLNR